MNNRTRSILDGFCSKPSSSLIIDGDQRSGYESAITELSQKLLGDRYPSNLHRYLPPVDKTIGIDLIRDIRSTLSTKAATGRDVTRLVVIENAEKMTIEAQNALLKLIEEPGERTVIALQTNNSPSLLPTIRSRCQVLPLLPLSKTAATLVAQTEGFSHEEANKAYILSGGREGLFRTTLRGENEQDFSHSKRFLQLEVFDRLQLLKKYDKKDDFMLLLSELSIIAEAALHTSSGKALQRWARIVKEIKNIHRYIQQNGNVKLAFLKLCVMVY